MALYFFVKIWLEFSFFSPVAEQCWQILASVERGGCMCSLGFSFKCIFSRTVNFGKLSVL